MLVIAGDDRFGENSELEPRLKSLVEELGVGTRVVFTGYRDDLPNLMNLCELVLIPSDAEPFGRVAIEAMALAKPVIGTRAGGLPEVVRDGETGLLVVPRFPESLADACLRVMGNPSLAHSFGEAGQQRVAENFSISRTSKETQALYESMLHTPLKWAIA